ncbi:MAG: M18 family aminopeptidase [Nitrospinaceae bacterium]
MTPGKNSHLYVCRSLLDFIDRSPTPFHVVHELGTLLEKDGFLQVREEDAWKLSPGGKYYVTRNGSSLMAFITGTKSPETAGFKIIGAHTDSPNLRLKPNPVYQKSGYVQLGVEVYGGVLLATWTDRDLSVAGRVILRSRRGSRSRLIRFGKPLLRIPQLAIHLNREVNTKGLILNKQTHLPPILGLSGDRVAPETVLKDMVASELKCSAGDIVGMELSLYDVQPGALAGPESEFLFAPRLDNLASCHAAALALLDSPARTVETRVLAFYDNEEVGSETAQGGGSPLLKDTLERILLNYEGTRESFMRAVARSIFISADMAHAVHPNYTEQHDSRHLPVLNGGPVIKSHAGQKYATEGISSACFELLCERAGVPVQKFVTRSDLACGSTIGPVTAANLGIRAVDVGNPMLSMHSIREMVGSEDHANIIRVFMEFFKS